MSENKQHGLKAENDLVTILQYVKNREEKSEFYNLKNKSYVKELEIEQKYNDYLIEDIEMTSDTFEQNSEYHKLQTQEIENQSKYLQEYLKTKVDQEKAITS